MLLGKQEKEINVPDDIRNFIASINKIEWNEDIYHFARRLGVTIPLGGDIEPWIRQKYLAFRELASALRKFDPETLYWLVTKKIV